MFSLPAGVSRRQTICPSEAEVLEVANGGNFFVEAFDAAYVTCRAGADGESGRQQAKDDRMAAALSDKEHGTPLGVMGPQAKHQLTKFLYYKNDETAIDRQFIPGRPRSGTPFGSACGRAR